MIRRQLVLDLHGELIVDNFAGGGGASTGIEMGLGRCVDVAVNHDQEAVRMHEANHPQTRHLCEDVWAVDPVKECGGRPVGLAWFSPDCKHFSKAKGGKPLSKKIRGLAWLVVKWGALVRPRVMMLENVEEFRTWGPLLACGRVCPKEKGRTFRAFVQALTTGLPAEHPDMDDILSALGPDVPMEALVRGLGYALEWKELRAYHYGTPTIRKRLFIVMRCDGQPIVWPEPTHDDPKKIQLLGKAGRHLKPWKTAAECIDFGILCPSLFLTKEEARALGVKRPLAEASERRVAKGTERYVMKADRPFLVSVTHVGGDRVENVDEPWRTVTGAQRGEKAVVSPVVAKYYSAKRAGDDRVGTVEEPLPTQSTENRFGEVEASVAAPFMAHTAHGEMDKSGKKRGRGTHECAEPMPTTLASQDMAVGSAQVAAPFVTEHANGSNPRNFSAEEPLRTQCAQVKGGHFAEVEAKVAAPELFAAGLVQTGYGEREGQEARALDVDRPMGTVVAGGVKHAPVVAHVAAPVVVNVANSKTTGRGPNVWPADEPARTVTSAPGFADVEAKVATPFMAGCGGPTYGGKPKSVESPHQTVVVENHGAVVEAAVAFTAGVGGRAGQSRPRGGDEPTATGTSKADTVVCAAHVARQFGTAIGRGVDEPAATTMTQGGGGKSEVVASFVARQFGASVGHGTEEPSGTVTAGGDGKSQVVAGFLAQQNGGMVGHAMAEPVSTMTQTCSHQAVVAVSLVKYYRTDQDPQMEEPVHTATTKHRFGVNEAGVEIPPLTPERAVMARRVAAFLRKYGVEFEGEFATTKSGLVIYDLGLRMMTPRELYRAQGFPEDYVINPIVKDGRGMPRMLSKTAQVRMCGNSVCPPVARALAMANVPELAMTWAGRPGVKGAA